MIKAKLVRSNTSLTKQPSEHFGNRLDTLVDDIGASVLWQKRFSLILFRVPLDLISKEPVEKEESKHPTPLDTPPEPCACDKPHHNG